MLHLKRASCGACLTERGMLHLKYNCFKKGLKEGGIITFKTLILWFLAYRTRNITFKERFSLFKAHGKRNIKFEERFLF